MADYRISLGVDVNVNDIRDRISAYNANSNNAKLKLGVKLDTKGISNQIKGINSKTPVKLGVKLDTKDAQRQINNIRRQIQQLGDIKISLGGTGNKKGNIGGNAAANDANKTANNLATAYTKLRNISKNIGSIKIKLDGLDASKDMQQIKLLESQLQSLTVEYNKTVDKIKNKGDLSSTQWANIQQQIDNTKIKLEQLHAELSDAKNNAVKNITKGLENGKFNKQIIDAEAAMKKLSSTSGGIDTAMNKVKAAFKDMQTASKSGNMDALISANERYERALKSLNNQIGINIKSEQMLNNADNLDLSKKNALLKLESMFENGSEAARRFGSEVQRLRSEINQCSNDAGMKNINKQISNLDMRVKGSGLQTQTIGTRLKEQFDRYKNYLSIASVFMYATQGLKDMFQQVVAVDTAMTELKKVTNETDASYDRFLGNAAKRSKEIGTTIDGLVGSTADFARLGYSFEQSAGLAEVANIYAVVGDEIDGVEGATQSLVSTMAAFKSEMGEMSDSDFAMSIVDKFNEVSNNFAISSGGIGEAMERSASSLKAANNTIDESIAMITAANEVTQNPEKVGNAMKTISMRIRGAKTELEEAGESTEGMVESTATLRKEIMALSGVDIMLNEDTFKSTYQIMDELSAKWENLSDIQQATIIELMAGKHQGNVFSSLMANFDTARAALETSLNSSGSALEEHSKWSDSLEARLNKLKSTWQSLSLTFMNSDFLKAGISGITGFVDGIDKLIDKIGVLPTLLSGLTLFKSLFGKGSSFGLFSTFNTDVDGFANKIGILSKSFAEISSTFNSGKTGSGIQSFFSGLKSVKNSFKNSLSESDLSAIKSYNSLIDQGVDGQSAWQQSMGGAGAAAQNLVAGANGGKVALQGLTAAANTSKVAMLGLKAATAALNIGLTLAISALISYGIKKFDEWHESASELEERIKNVTEDYKSQHNELMKLKGDYDTTKEDSMISKYAELSKGVNSLGENLSLTADEYSEYQNIVSKIASQNPDLVKGYNSQGQAILKYADDVDRLAQSYRDLVIEENNKVTDIGADIFKDFQNDLKGTSAYYQESYSSDKPTRIKYNESPISEHYDTKHLDKLQELMELSGKNDEEFNNAIENLTNDEINRLSSLLEEQGIERNKLGSGEAGWETKRQHVINALKGDKKEIKNVLDGAAADLNAYAEDMGTVTEAFFNTAFLGGNGKEIGDYSDISEKMQNAITQATSGLGADFYDNFLDPTKTNEQNYQDFINYYNDVLNKFKNLDDADAAKFEAAFDLKTKFNGGDISYGEYVKGIQEAGNIVDGMELGDELTAQIQLALNTEEVSTDYDALEKRFTEKYELEMETDEAQKKAKEFLNNLSASEYSVAIDLIANKDINFDDFGDIKSLREYIEKQAKLKEAMNYTIAITAETESVEALNTAMSESVSGAGLSSEAIAALKDRYSELASEGYDLSSMFEETANGIHLNKDAVGDLEQVYASNKLSEAQKHLDTLKGRYDELTKEIEKCTDASERAGLYREQQAVAQKINDLGTLAAQYQGLASSYNAWQSAESGGNERDMYEGVISGFKTIKDELSRGWLDDGTIKFLELMTGETNLAGESASKLKGIWDGLDEKIKGTSYSVKDFFTTNKDGESTNTGVYNFLRAVQELESSDAFKNIEGIKDLVQMEDGKVVGFNFDIVGGDEAIAKALGISEELVQIILRAADDAGFVVTLDGNWTQFADLKIAAEEANDAIKKLASSNEDLKSAGFGEYDFNFGASSIEDIDKELSKAKELLNNEAFKDEFGKFDKRKKGAEDALKIAETLQVAKNKAEEPIYMSVDTAKLEKDLQEPVQKLKDFEALRQERSLLNLTGTDQKRIKEINTELDTLTNELLSLPDEVKTDLGINDDDYKSLREKLESGKIEVPTELSIEANMDKNLEDLVTLGLFEKGFISEETAKVRLNADIEPKINNPEAVSEAVDDAVNKDGGSTEAATVTQDIEVETGEVKTESHRDTIWNNVKNWWKNFWGAGKSESNLEAKANVEVKSGNIDASEVGENTKEETKNAVNDGGTVETKTDVNVKTENVNSDVEEKTDEAIKSESGKTETVEKNVNLELNVNDNISDLSSVLDSEALNDYNASVNVVAEVKGLDKINNLKTALSNIKDKTVKVLVKGAEAAVSAINSVKDALSDLKDKTINIKANGRNAQAQAQPEPVAKSAEVNYTLGDQAPPVDKSALVNYTLGTQEAPVSKTARVNYMRGWQQPPLDKTARVNYVAGSAGANGTANANGTAFANGTAGKAYKQGDWGTKDSGVALGGELGQEIIVRNGHFFTIGDNGAEFFHYKKGDIIFNHKQTEELFRNGRVTSGGGRAKALANGTAFVEGTAFSRGSGGMEEVKRVVVAVNPVTGKEYAKHVGQGQEDEFQETFDLIEIAIDRIERAIDSLDATANNIYKTWAERNESLVNQIGKVREEIDLQQKAYDKYIEAANAIGLSDDWKNKIQNGEMEIKAVKDEAIVEQIKDYKDYYEKALDCKDAIEELKETESELYAQRVENVSTRYEGILGVIEHEKNMLEEYINQSEEQAWLVSAKYYNALANNERENIAELEKQKADMLEEFNAAMDSGTIAEGSESWYEMCASIDEVTESITKSQTQLLEYQQTLQQLSWEVFDILQEKISAVTGETEFLIELMSNKKLYDDNGKLTDEASATMGLHGVAYNTYMHQADQAAVEVERLKKELEKDPYDTELEERYREMIELQQEYILNAESEKDAIRNLIEEGIQLEIEALEERIDKYNESIKSVKDLYEYQKKVKEQTEEIASLEKQMSAYAGDDSEEARAKIQELKVSLEEAKSELEQTEYEKYIEDTEKLLDNLLIEYEEFYNARLDNIDALISDMITEINTDAGIIGDTIREAADSVGYTLSDSMNTIWDENSVNTNNVITTYGDKFVNAQTTTNNALNNINTNLQNIIAQLNKKADTNIKSVSTSSTSKLSSTNNTNESVSKNTTSNSGGDGKPKVGDRVKYESGQYYYDSQGTKPLGSHKKGEYVYITNINTKDWATHGYHISTGKTLGDGDLGWLKLNQISGYATGAKKILSDELAWTQENGTEFIVRPSDGAILTPVSKNDKIFNHSASNNLWNMANSPAEFIRDNLNLGTTSIPSNSTIQSSYTQHLDKVVFNLPNVKNYDELLSAMQKDKNFERLIDSMTFDKMTGKSSLGKKKSIR